MKDIRLPLSCKEIKIIAFLIPPIIIAMALYTRDTTLMAIGFMTGFLALLFGIVFIIIYVIENYNISCRCDVD